LPADDPEAPAASEVESELIRRDVARRIQEAGHTAGKVPEHWRRWADGVLAPPKVDWRRVLAAEVRSAITAAGMVDYSYSRPSRRQAAVPGVVLPTMRRPLPDVAVIIDSSGSMSDAQIARAMAETADVLRAVGAAAPVIVCDAAVHVARRVHDVRQVHVVGGGGTDMRVAIDAACKLRPRPSVIVCLTDGYTPWPDHAPAGVRVVVGIIGSGQAPNWARAVKVEV
jgi:predicted metal-dependent peptidase